MSIRIMLVTSMGSSVRSSDVSAWDGMRGFYGAGRMNEAGKMLLSFCALNELLS